MVTAKHARRTQADRSSKTRRKIIDATIECLYRVGYSATTISMVAKEARVSRSMIAYHFDSKADLMVAVRDTVQRDEHKQLVEFEKRTGSDVLVGQLERLVFVGMRKKPAMAVNEILLASRGDADLSAKLKRIEREIDDRSSRYYLSLLERVGIKPPENHVALEHLTVAAIRGLAITELVQGEDADVNACIDLFSELIRPIYQKAKRMSAAE